MVGSASHVGNYGNAALDTRSATIAPRGDAPTALVMKEGQQVCWAGFNVCWRYDPAAQKMMLRWNGQDVASIDRKGAARFRGSVTGNVAP